MESNPDLTSPIAQDKQKLEEWRRQRRGNHPIPAEVWQSILSYVPQMGLNRVSRAFRLNYVQLKQKALASGVRWPDKPSRKGSAANGFVPLIISGSGTPDWMGNSAPRVILERADGRQLRIEGGWPEARYLETLAAIFFRG